jgi:2'-5' RNA ligase
MSMRAFLSLNPDPQTAMDIDRWSALCWLGIERRVPAQNLHVTLAFLGEISQQTEADINEYFSTSAAGETCQLTFDKVGYWPQPKVLWLGCESVPASLNVLAQRCRTLANRVGIRVNGKRFEPHITLARNPASPPQPPLTDPAFTVRFDSIQLCESFLDKRGARYSIRESWALTPD